MNLNAALSSFTQKKKQIYLQNTGSEHISTKLWERRAREKWGKIKIA